MSDKGGKKKIAKSIEVPSGVKEAKETPGTSIYDKKAAWRVSRVQMADPYGWHVLSLDKIQFILNKLAEFERNTWGEIFLRDKHWNHALPVGNSNAPKRVSG